MPPSLAIAMASRYSVTVSMAADTIGVFNSISLVSFERVDTSRGRTLENAGTSNTSSKVSASCICGDFELGLSMRKDNHMRMKCGVTMLKSQRFKTMISQIAYFGLMIGTNLNFTSNIAE